MTDVLDLVRAADPAAALGRLVSDGQLVTWREEGLRHILSASSRPADVPAPSSDVGPRAAVATLPGQRRTGDVDDGPSVTDLASAEPRRRVRAPRRWWLPAAGVAAVAALAITIGLPSRPAPAMAATPPVLHYAQTSSTSKAEVQALAQDCLERQRPHRSVPSEFTVRWQEWSLGTRVDGEQVTSAIVPMEVSLTKHEDGSAELLRRTSAPRFPNRASRERWVDAGRPAATPVTMQHQRWAAGRFTPAAASLPDDPSRLLPALSVGHPIAQIGDAEVLVAIGDAYRSTRLSPAQQAALFTFAASRPGVEPLGRVTDRAGRTGYALSVESDHSGLPTRYTAIFDPVSGRLLDLEQTLTTSAGSLNVRVPATIGYTVFE